MYLSPRQRLRQPATKKELRWMQLATEIHSIQVAKCTGFLLCFPPLTIPIAGSTKQVFQTNTHTLSPPRGVSNRHFFGIANMILSHRKITKKLIFGNSKFRTD